MVSGAASALLLGRSSALAATAKLPDKVSSGPAGASPARLSLEDFLEISRAITEHDELDPVVGAKILASLEGDPKHRANLPVLSARIRARKTEEKLSAADFSISHSAVKDTLQEILTAWYVGVRMEGDKPVPLTYFDALMYRALDGLRNIPATCGGALNFWATPPQA
jgi:hypothetical protein